MRGAGVAVSSGLPVAMTVVAMIVVLSGGVLRLPPPPAAPTHRPSASFVSLDEQTEIEILRHVKDEWRKSGGEKRVDADLLFSELPEAEKSAILPIASRSRPPSPALAEGPVTPFLPSQRAPAPVRTPVDPATPEGTFSREELLKID